MTVILHESAHASVGLILGMKLRAFVVGPFQWRIRDGRWTYRFVPAGFLSFGGSTGIIPTNPNQSRWVEIAMIAAGPFINLLTGLLAALTVVSAKGHRSERFWEPLAFFALVNIVTFAVNLVPFRPEALYSDGARIFQFLSGGPWATLHRIFSTVLSSTVTPLRPRDYDIQAIQSAASHFTHGREALMLRLFATSYYLDQDQIPEARATFAEAVSIVQDSDINIPPDLLTTFVFKPSISIAMPSPHAASGTSSKAKIPPTAAWTTGSPAPLFTSLKINHSKLARHGTSVPRSPANSPSPGPMNSIAIGIASCAFFSTARKPMNPTPRHPPANFSACLHVT